MGRKLAASAILVVFLAIVSAAQNITATMVGTVRDMTGGVLPGVDINIVHVQTNRSFQLLTDETGSYRIAAPHTLSRQVQFGLKVNF
jgi:carboxypeptidase family protein